MSTVRDRGVIDITLVEGEKYVLVIFDDMEWTPDTRQNHGQILQNKLNDYLNYIAGGQAAQAKPGLRPVIRILAKYSYSKYCLDFLGRVQNHVKNNGDICEIEWTHSEEDGPFEDGFSDDPVFDLNKVYPRLKKNLAKDPLKEVSLMAPFVPGGKAQDYPDNLIMIRVLDSFIGLFVWDVGNAYTYVTYDMLPEGVTVDQLGKVAFDNLIRDTRYQTTNAKDPDIHGIIAGGNFEAESLLLNDIWNAVSEELQDDVLIAVPTKDMVLYVKASEPKHRKKLIKMAEKIRKENQKSTPYLLFCDDLFLYSKADGTLKVCDKI